MPMTPLWTRRAVVRAYRASKRSYYATEATGRRKAVTVINDDGRVGWSDLRPMEKVARTTQQTFNFGMVLLGIAMTGGVGYFLWGAVFSPESKTSHFNRAVDELRAHARVRELLGPANKIHAYGDGGWNRWTRNAPIRSTVTKDRNGRDHMLLEFNLEGPRGRGRVRVHMVRAEAGSAYEYKKLSLDVPGNQTVYLYNDAAVKQPGKGFNFLGFNWKK